MNEFNKSRIAERFYCLNECCRAFYSWAITEPECDLFPGVCHFALSIAFIPAALEIYKCYLCRFWQPDPGFTINKVIIQSYKLYFVRFFCHMFSLPVSYFPGWGATGAPHLRTSHRDLWRVTLLPSKQKKLHLLPELVNCYHYFVGTCP